jgi:hypothetical protein
VRVCNRHAADGVDIGRSPVVTVHNVNSGRALIPCPGLSSLVGEWEGFSSGHVVCMKGGAETQTPKENNSNNNKLWAWTYSSKASGTSSAFWAKVCTSHTEW